MPVRKPGLSIDEKCRRVQAFLQERRVPFTLKELESALPKAKGVIFQSVQECLDVLVSENRAQTDKVGISVLFWNFDDGTQPQQFQASAAGGAAAGAVAIQNLAAAGADAMKQHVAGLEQKRDTLARQLADASAQAVAATESPAQAAHRAQMIDAAAQLRATKQRLTQQIQDKASAMALSPERLRKQFLALRSIVNAWTDNVMLLEDRAAASQHGMHRTAFRQRFGIDAHFDFV